MKTDTSPREVREMKWYGSPPVHWKPTRLKFLFCEKTPTSTPEFPAGAISFGSVVEKDMLNDDTLSSYQDVRVGNFLVNPINLNYDLKSLRTALSELNVRVSPAYLVLEGRADANSRYLRWLLHLFDVAHMKTLGAGVRQTITFKDMGVCRAFLPPIGEQERIANFLDEQTARIDVLIAEKQRLAETLKVLKTDAIDRAALGNELMHEGRLLSGLEVLGRLPAGWVPSRLKFELDYVTSGSRGWADFYTDEGALFVRIGNLTRDSVGLDLRDVQRVTLPDATEGVRARVQPGDLLISITAYLGSVAVAPDDVAEAYVSQHVALARPNKVRALPKWLGYVVLSSIGRTFFDLQAYGGTKVQLSLDDIRELPVPLPPPELQAVRIQELESRLFQLSQVEAHVALHIDRLSEYRSSLISAAVTGQVDINAYRTPKAAELEVA